MGLKPSAISLGALISAISAIALTHCSTQSHHTMLVSQHSSKPEDCSIDIFPKGEPSKRYERVARLDVHIERTYYVRSNLEDAVPELKKEACLSGADAVIDIKERGSTFNLAETHSYHVTATAIRYLPSR